MKLFKRIICWFKGHKFQFWGLAEGGDSVMYEKCGRCGAFKDDGKAKLKTWMQNDNRSVGWNVHGFKSVEA